GICQEPQPATEPDTQTVPAGPTPAEIGGAAANEEHNKHPLGVTARRTFWSEYKRFPTRTPLRAISFQLVLAGLRFDGSGHTLLKPGATAILARPSKRALPSMQPPRFFCILL